ncbi:MULTISPECIES: glycosyltransferase [unclassified Thioalkalivibrio]|uniref:glycosyltransferase n=1 Tax=unclassified Thioalkalivibrio TaxID=2621013 RepID=UPI0009DA14E3|nr:MULTISPECIES: glycosyltransferase [unclassified Thioalkalivibrio]
MRILLALNRLFLPQRSGGIESSVHDLANALYKRGTQSTVLSRLRALDGHGIKTLSRRILLGGRPRPEPFGAGYNVFRTPMMTRDLPNILKQVHPDIALLQGTGRLELGRVLEHLGVPTALHVRDVEFRDSHLPFKPVTVIANSKFTASRFQYHFNQQCVVIPNLFDANAYRTRRRGEKVVFINPVQKKGLEIAIGLARDNPSIPFLFVEGWPQNKPARLQLLERLKRLPNVTFLKRQNDMRPVYESARIVLVPSQWEEAWGRVITEAQFSGIPVLASDTGGIPEALGPGGLLLPPSDLDAWNSALRNVWENSRYWEALSLAALDYSKRPELDPELITHRVIEVLTRSIAK